ncbi:MAG: hypothetical protein ACREIA_03665 [Opitutaceae bacterium]
MNENQDEDLRQVLRTWEVSTAADPQFAANVWRRIAAGEREAAGVWLRVREWFLVQLPRPAYAASLLVATTVLSVAAANLHANHVRDRHRLENARQYLTSIDPLSMAANASRQIQ